MKRPIRRAVERAVHRKRGPQRTPKKDELVQALQQLVEVSEPVWIAARRTGHKVNPHQSDTYLNALSQAGTVLRRMRKAAK
jgi:hypothetical protein